MLTDSELAAVWHAAPHLGAVFGPMTRVLILTAQRAGEVAAMRWADLDLVDGAALWIIPREAYKTSRAHAVPLSPAAAAILAALPRGGEFVFSAAGGGAPVHGRSKAKARLDAKLPDLPAWTWHDLRRTAATGMARLGVLPHITEAVLGHVTGALSPVGRIYQRADYGDEKRRALALAGRGRT